MNPAAPSRCDVFLALLSPTFGSEPPGTRPAVVVSRDAINYNSSMVICVPFTNFDNCPKIYPSQVVVKKGSGGLAKVSVALCEQVRAITSTRLRSLLGKLDRQTLTAVDERLKIALDLD